MKAKAKKQTTLEVEGLELARTIYRTFDLTTKYRIKLNPTTIVAKAVQKYLDSNLKTAPFNKLRGILAIQDSFPNATGGRVHLIAIVSGPLGEAFDSRIIPAPTDYEDKSRLFLKALSGLSKRKIDGAGNIHVHVLNYYGKSYRPKDLIAFLRDEHGHQNEVLQIAPFKMFYLDTSASEPDWKVANSSTLKKMFT